MRTKIIILLALSLLLLSGSASNAALSDAGTQSLRSLKLHVGHSQVINVKTPVKRVSVGDVDVAEVLAISPHRIYVNAMDIGTTNLNLWDDDDKIIEIVEIRVGRNLSVLKQHLAQILPREQVEVREMEGAVVLSGRVSDAASKKKAEDLAEALIVRADKDKWKVKSLLEVGALNQVLLKVRFAEVSRRALKRMKFNLGFIDTFGNLLFTFLGGLTLPVPPQQPGPLFDLSISNQITSIGALDLGNGRLFGFIDALKENGLAKILAEPNLVAASGEEASFLAGGEYPYPVPQKEFITIKWKKFGVKLKFKPEVLDDGRIRLEVAPEVSELDWTTALVVAQGFVVPGLKVRRAKTQLEIKSGDSFAMAGLFRDDNSQLLGRVPWLGDIPILGTLFRSNEFQSLKTELVIVVTPEIIKPGEVAKAKMPPLKAIIPDDVDHYLMGDMFQLVHETEGVPKSMKEMEGKFGHAPPF